MELDDDYANFPYIPGAETFPPMWVDRGLSFRMEMQSAGRARLDVPYGESPRQAFDLFLPKSAQKGLCVFVHGGYWMKFSRDMWSHLAAGPLAHGFAVAMPSYDLCPDVRISDITKQVANAISAAAGLIDGPVVLAGHSAGGHLVARMAVKGVLDIRAVARVRQVLSISPVSDLRPLLKTSMNSVFRLTEKPAIEESPTLRGAPHVPVSVWVGADERPVFLDQARWLAEAWNTPLSIARNKHHFDVIEALEDPESEMVQTLLSNPSSVS